MGDAGHSRNPLEAYPETRRGRQAGPFAPSSAGGSAAVMLIVFEQVAQAARLQQDAIERVGLLRRKVVHLH